jgi:carboxylesterase type B
VTVTEFQTFSPPQTVIMDSIIIIVLSIFISLQLTTISSAPTAPVVTTTLGKVKGVTKILEDGNEVNLYYGIPYGKPPIGALRFSKPEPVSHWDGVYDATKSKDACPQTIGKLPIEAPIGEDCLFLSVWQPAKALTDGKKRTVMFWIHGGGFDSGTMFTVAYDARMLASMGDVIVVTINYRLGPFGFLYGGTKDAPGNIGLHDQILALKWTHDHINSFGGDPSSITIFGESAGGMSVGALVLSPLTKGLFKRAIMQSGSPNSYLGSKSKEVTITKTHHFAKQLNCNQTDMTDILACLRKKSINDILNISQHSTTSLEPFDPIYGDELMPMKPSEALKGGHFNQNVELLFGLVKDEGSIFVDEILSTIAPNKHINITLSKAKSYISLMFMILNETNSAKVANFYTAGLKDTDSDKLLESLSNSFGDYQLTCPTVLFGAAFAKSEKAYSYKLTHFPTIHAFPGCHGWMGVCHADDVILLFGFPIRLKGIGYDELDYKLSVDMIHVWSTFAKTGVPPALDGVKWVEAIDRNVANPSVRYMELNPAKYRIVENGYKSNCDEFWKPHMT